MRVDPCRFRAFAGLLHEAGHGLVIFRGAMGAKSRAAALARLQPQPGGPPLRVVATGPYAGEGVDCPALDTLFLSAPVANKTPAPPGAARSASLYFFDPGGTRSCW